MWRGYPKKIFFYIMIAENSNGKNFTMRFRTWLDLEMLTISELKDWASTILKDHMEPKLGRETTLEFMQAGYEMAFVFCINEEASKSAYNKVRAHMGHYAIH